MTRSGERAPDGPRGHRTSDGTEIAPGLRVWIDDDRRWGTVAPAQWDRPVTGPASPWWDGLFHVAYDSKLGDVRARAEQMSVTDRWGRPDPGPPAADEDLPALKILGEPGHSLNGRDSSHSLRKCQECAAVTLYGMSFAKAEEAWVDEDAREAYFHIWATWNLRGGAAWDRFEPEPRDPGVLAVVRFMRNSLGARSWMEDDAVRRGAVDRLLRPALADALEGTGLHSKYLPPEPPDDAAWIRSADSRCGYSISCDPAEAGHRHYPPRLRVVLRTAVPGGPATAELLTDTLLVKRDSDAFYLGKIAEAVTLITASERERGRPARASGHQASRRRQDGTSNSRSCGR